MNALPDRLAVVGFEFSDDGTPPAEFLPPDERATVEEAVEALRENGPGTGTLIVNLADGSPIAVAVEAASLYADVAVHLADDGYLWIEASDGSSWAVTVSLANNSVASPSSPNLLRSFDSANDALLYWTGSVIGLAAAANEQQTPA